MKKTNPSKPNIWIPRRYRDDIAHLESHFGALTAGMKIETELKELKNICARDQVKVSAYVGLQNYLRRSYGVDLIIYSQKNKKKST